MTTYRTPEKTPLCASCGGGSLTPATKFDTSEGYPNVYFRNTKVQPSFFGGSDRQWYPVDRARICLDCGHVMLFFSAERLGMLRAETGSLKPVND